MLAVLHGLKLELLIYAKEKRVGILETKWQGYLGLERGLIRAQNYLTIHSTRSPFATLLSRRAESGR